jgi:hypothetical protein
MITLKRILTSSSQLISKMGLLKVNPQKVMNNLTQMNYYNFAFMSLFENNKKP